MRGKVTKMPKKNLNTNTGSKTDANTEPYAKFDESVKATLLKLQTQSFISGMRTAANVVLDCINEPKAPVTTEGIIQRIKEFCEQTLKVRDKDILKSLNNQRK